MLNIFANSCWLGNELRKNIFNRCLVARIEMMYHFVVHLFALALILNRFNITLVFDGISVKLLVIAVVVAVGKKKIRKRCDQKKKKKKTF